MVERAGVPIVLAVGFGPAWLGNEPSEHAHFMEPIGVQRPKRIELRLTPAQARWQETEGASKGRLCELGDCPKAKKVFGICAGNPVRCATKMPNRHPPGAPHFCQGMIGTIAPWGK